MDFEFSAEQEELGATVRRFLVNKAPIRPYVRDQLDNARGTTTAVWKGLADLGATGVLAPARHGGAGLGMVDMGAVVEEMGRGVHPGPFRSSAIGAVSAVLLVGTEDDQAELLPALVSGESIGTVHLGVGFAAESTGAQWTVQGAAAMVPDAGAADILTVAASDGETAGLFTVPIAQPGVDVTPVTTVDGTSKFASVRLERAPARRLGLAADDSTEAMVELADRLAVAHTVDGVGAAEAALELAIEYARERVQFDRPIGSFQAVQHLCADMLQWVELARAGAYYALWALDSAEPAERHRAATMALAYGADTLHRVGATAIQVFGGIGFTWDHDAHLYYKRLLTLQQAGGGAMAQFEALAGIILG